MTASDELAVSLETKGAIDEHGPVAGRTTPIADILRGHARYRLAADDRGGRAVLEPASSCPLIAIPVSFVPAVMAWLVLRVAGTADERRAWRRRLTRVRVGWRWYAIALLALPLAYLAGLGIATAGGGAFPFHVQTLALLPIFLLTNFGEEIGWRGFALPRLQDRMSPLAASLVLGVIWGAFHWVALAGNADAPLAYIAREHAPARRRQRDLDVRVQRIPRVRAGRGADARDI